MEQAPVYNMLQRLSIHSKGSNGFDQSTFAKRQSICPVDSVLGTHAVDLGQQKDHMAEVRHGQGKLYRSVPSLYEATRIYKGTNIVASLAWYDHEDNDTFGAGRNGSSGASLFTFEETLIHFGSIVFCIFVTIIVVSVLTLVLVELRARLRAWRFSSRLAIAVYKFWSRLPFALPFPTNKAKASTNDEFSQVDKNSHVIPKHIAIIMDGNRRYGESKLKSKSAGHSKGGETLGNCVRWCQECGIKVLTVYAFSTENWKRDEKEVEFLMKTFEKYAKEILVKALKNDICVRVLSSEPELLLVHIRKLFDKIEKQTANNKSFTLNLCVSYGGRSEIIRATKQIVTDVLNGDIKSVRDIDEQLYERYLLTDRKNFSKERCNYSSGKIMQNNPDLLIRTSGECRLSNFLLYQLAYSEMIFLDKHWPEFSKDDLLDCIRVFSNRKRRYGK